MEKHKCKLCFKSYANGSALGGHMRSHMMNLPIQSQSHHRSIHEISPSSSSSSSEDDDKNHEHEPEEKGSLNYELRENPKRSFRLSDPGFAFVSTSSVNLPDRESEAESLKNSTRRRSKRIRRSNITVHNYYQQHFHEVEEIKKPKSMKIGEELSCADQEPGSSVSDTTTEEDLAFCLMMLSRDEWEKTKIDNDEDSYDSDEINLRKTARNRVGKYKCETCNKVFKSYQALGGHRASHKKNTLLTSSSTTMNYISSPKMEIGSLKIHECPYCFRVFASGQALGGHKRSHLIGSSSAAAAAIVKKASKFGDFSIDLNLPAQLEDDTDEYFEVSAVSD